MNLKVLILLLCIAVACDAKKGEWHHNTFTVDSLIEGTFHPGELWFNTDKKDNMVF